MVAGLFPFDCRAIPSWKIAPALPLQASNSDQYGRLAETPLRSELRRCFIEAVKPNETKGKPRHWQRVAVMYYGEALTSDESMECLKAAEEEKKQCAAEKKKGKKPLKEKGRRAVQRKTMTLLLR